MLITNGTLITWGDERQVLEDHELLIEDGLIASIGPAGTLASDGANYETIDAGGQLVMPGNICAHTHFYGAFARGMAIPGRAPADFPQILRKLWWPLDKALTEEAVRYSALVCLIDAIKHGTTTLIDHHASPNAIAGSLDILAQAVEQSGLRAVLCYEVTDRDGEDRAQRGWEENLRFIDRCRQQGVAGGRVAGAFGLHASMTLSDDTLATCRELAAPDTAFHIHVAEHEADEYDSLARAGVRIAPRLQSFGLLNEHSILAHAIHVDAEEMRLIAEAGARVTHQPRSNMNNGVGAAEVESLMNLGVPVCLGNDGFSNAMWDEWKAAYLLHKVWHRDPRRMSGDTVVEMAIDNNRKLAESFFRQAPMGVLAAGAQADIILVDYKPTTPLTAGNLPWHILFGFESSMVTSTIVAGELLMHERQLLGLDEAEVAAEARRVAAHVWERYPSFVPPDPPLTLGN